MLENLHLPDNLRKEIIEHCLAATPNEGCGLFAIDGGSVVAIYPTANADESPSSYTVPPDEHFAAMESAESAGWSIGGVFHSHPGGSARLSDVDVMDALEPRWVYLVVGLRGMPEIRAWRIREQEVQEVALR